MSRDVTELRRRVDSLDTSYRFLSRTMAVAAQRNEATDQLLAMIARFRGELYFPPGLLDLVDRLRELPSPNNDEAPFVLISRDAAKAAVGAFADARMWRPGRLPETNASADTEIRAALGWEPKP